MLKSFAPIVVLLIGSYYGYQWYPFLPTSASIGITYLTYMLALIVAGLSIRFSRSTVFFYVVLVLAANLSLRLGWAASPLAYALLSALLPLLLVVLTALPDRGILTVKATPAYAVLVLAGIFALAVSAMSPPWAAQLLLTDWAPARYFDWTGQAQSVSSS